MELLNGIGYCLHNGYGMSEIGITSVELRRRPKHRNLNSIGHPFVSVEYRLDENGVLQVRGTSLCVKKLVNGAPVQLDGWFDTGDQMECADGHYYIQGRRSDVVIGESGENINPDMIEKVFQLGDVKQMCVLGLPGQNGQELAMIAQINPYFPQSRIEQLKKQIYQINETLPVSMAVRSFYFTYDDLAGASAIKISRAQLLKKIESRQVEITPFNQFKTEQLPEGQPSALMIQVCKIIAQVLELEEAAVTVDAHIFHDLGATSMQYFSIIAALAEHFSITSYESNDTYRYTPKEICEYIERNL